MRGQASNYLGVVREEAAKIVQAAHAEAEQIRRQAEAAGRKAAEAAVERILDEKVARRMDTLVPALEQLVAQVNDAKSELLGHWQRSAVRVATAIAERIIRRELQREPQITLDLVEEALRLAAGTADITVRMNPTDYENLGPQVERLAAALCAARAERASLPTQRSRSAVAASKPVSVRSTCRSSRSSAAWKKS